jgi:hypothetical protein
MKNILRNLLIALLTGSSSAFAANAASNTEGGLLISLLIGFFTLILIFQLIPASLMLVGMLRGLFSGKSEAHYQ